MPLNDDEDAQRRDLKRALEGSPLNPGQLWLKYFALGGSSGEFEVEGYLFGAYALEPMERDLLAHAMNEHFMGCGLPTRVRYSSSPESDDR